MLGAVLGVIFYKVIGASFLITFVVITFFLVVIGITIRFLIVKPLREKEHLMVIIATAALSIIFKTLVIVWWGPEGDSFPSIFGEDPIDFYGLIVIPQNIWIALIGIFFMIILYIFLKNTIVGIKMRAVAQDRLGARLLGISIDKMDTIAFGIASALAGFAGILMAPIYFVTPDMGGLIGLKGFICAVIGGFGSIPGAMVGGLILGVIENIITCFISSGYRDAIAFFILIVILYFLPEGLFKRRIERRI